VEELRERPQELVAYMLRGDPLVGAEKFFSCQERHGANRHDGYRCPWSNLQPISIVSQHVWLLFASYTLRGECQSQRDKRHGRSVARPPP